MKHSTILWVDLSLVQDRSYGTIPYSTDCVFHRVVQPSEIHRSIKATDPHLICFEFDFLTLPGLRAMRKTKDSHPSRPILMITEQHSEAIAVWAFRAGVRDYVVKPVSEENLLNRIRFLIRRPPATHSGLSRSNVLPHEPIPKEFRHARVGTPSRKTAPAISYVDLHFHEKIRLKTVARLCGLDSFQFSRRFKQEHGFSFREYLLRYRVNKAQEFLQFPNAAIVDIACAIGFTDASHLARAFRRFVGITPSEYRQRSRIVPTGTGT